MSRGKILALALGTQGLLIGSAWTGSRIFEMPPQWGDPLRDTVIGSAIALVLACVNYALLVHAPSSWIVEGVRAVYRDILTPLFGGLDRLSVIALGAAAGVGEEWLFRGLLQPAVGLPIASVVFGLAHVGGRGMLPFGVWASGMGFVLGTLANVTGGLTAPMVAHGLYDMLALEYIRRGAHFE